TGAEPSFVGKYNLAATNLAHVTSDLHVSESDSRRLHYFKAFAAGITVQTSHSRLRKWRTERLAFIRFSLIHATSGPGSLQKSGRSNGASTRLGSVELQF